MKNSIKSSAEYRRKDIACAFGATLRAACKERGISQDKLSEICELDRTYPSLLERGLRGPTLAVLLRLAEALGVEPGQLVSGTVDRMHMEANHGRL